MPETYTLNSVETYFTNPDTECWMVNYTKPDGTGHVHLFPKNTLDWRAAEYGIDPTDVDTLLDIVLHEPFVDPEDTAVRDAGKMSPSVRNFQRTRMGDMVPTSLFNAACIEDAREAHLLRIEDAKTRVTIETPASSARGLSRLASLNPLDAIKSEYTPEPDAVAEKAAVVEAQRDSAIATRDAYIESREVTRK